MFVLYIEQVVAARPHEQFRESRHCDPNRAGRCKRLAQSVLPSMVSTADQVLFALLATHEVRMT